MTTTMTTMTMDSARMMTTTTMTTMPIGTRTSSCPRTRTLAPTPTLSSSSPKPYVPHRLRAALPVWPTVSRARVRDQAGEYSFSAFKGDDDELVDGGIVTSPLDTVEPYVFFAQHMEGNTTTPLPPPGAAAVVVALPRS